MRIHVLPRPVHDRTALKVEGNLVFGLIDPGQPTVRAARHVQVVLGVATLPDGDDVALQPRDTRRVPVDRAVVVRESDEGPAHGAGAVGRDGKARLRVVRLGSSPDGNTQVVLSGVSDGDLLVDNPPPGLRAGTQITTPAEPETVQNRQ